MNKTIIYPILILLLSSLVFAQTYVLQDNPDRYSDETDINTTLWYAFSTTGINSVKYDSGTGVGGTNSLRFSGISGSTIGQYSGNISSGFNSSQNYTYQCMIYDAGTDTGQPAIFCGLGNKKDLTGNSIIYGFYTGSSNSNYLYNNDGSYHNCPQTRSAGFHNFTFVRTSDDGGQLFIDGTGCANMTKSGVKGNFTYLYVYRNTGGSPTNYYYDDIAVYTSGSESAPLPPSANLSVTAYNNYGEAMLNFTANIGGANFTTTDGTAETSVNASSPSLYTININAENYFPMNYANVNISSATFRSNGSFQSDIRIYAYTIVNRTQIMNFSLNDTYLRDGTTSGSINLKLKAGARGLTLNNSLGYFNTTETFNITALSNTSVNFTVYNAKLNVSARNGFTGASVLNFSLNLSTTAWTGTGSALNVNSTVLNLEKTFNYTIVITAPGYGFSNDTNLQYVYFDSATAYKNITFNLYTNNSIYMVIRDENSNALITDTNITIVLTSGATENTYYSKTGYYFVDNLTDGSYSVKFSGGNYTLKTYNVVVASGSTQVLNAYLALNTEQVIISFLNRNTGASIEDVSLTISRIINSSWVSVLSKTSDITGRIQFEYTPSIKYRFYATKTGYSSKTWDLDPVLFEEYNVLMNPTATSLNNTQDFAGISVIFYPKTFINAVNNNITFVFSSPDGLLEDYGYNISYPGGSGTFSDNNAYGSVDLINFTISGASFLSLVNITTWYKSSMETEYRVYNYGYLIEGYSSNYTFVDLKNRDFGLGTLEKVMISTLIIIILFAVASLTAGVLVGMAISIFLFILFTWLGYIPLWGSIIAIFVGFIIMATRSSR